MSLPSTSSGVRRGHTDGDVYVFALQTAYLAHLIVCEREAASERESVAAAPSSASLDVPRPYLAGVTDRMRELRVGSGTRAPRFPERLPKRLVERLERIAMGRDTQYNQPLFRQTIGAFYGALVDDSTQRRLRDSRSIEELLHMFVASARPSLRKRLPDEASRRAELDTELDLFVRVVRECLRVLPNTPRDLLDRLNDDPSLLAGLAQPPRLSVDTRGRSSMDVPRPADTAVHSALVRATGQLFGVDGPQLRLDVQSVSEMCSLTAGVVDLKRCVYQIHTQQAWPGAPGDFVTPEAYQRWRAAELAQLSALMVDMCRAKPQLLASPGAADSTSLRRASLASAEAAASGGAPAFAEEAASEFTYIPPDAPAAYQRLLELCLEADLDAIRRKAAHEEVPLAIFSPIHQELLAVCAQRWRITPAFRIAAHLRALRSRYECGDVPSECISEALGTAECTLRNAPPDAWRRVDRQGVRRTLEGLGAALVRAVLEQLQDGCDPATPAALVERAQRLAAAVDGSPALLADAGEVRMAMENAAIRQYAARATEVFAPGSDLFGAFGAMLDYVEHEIARLGARSPAPLLGVVPSAVAAEKLVPLYLDDLESAREAALLAVHGAADDRSAVNDALELYRRVAPLARRYRASEALVRGWFRPYVEAWLAQSERQAAAWVHSAVMGDTFEPLEDAVHSTSITDVSDALQQQVGFVLALQWTDAYENALFLTALARAITQRVEQYAHEVADLYMAEMAPSESASVATAPSRGNLLEQALSSDALAALPHQAWVARAKQSLARERRIEPFVLQPRSCVKLNDIEAARLLLDSLYQRIDADAQAQIVHAHVSDGADDSLASATSVPTPQFVFAVKIVQAELPSLATSREFVDGVTRLDTFVTLSDERGERLAKTRTIFDSSSPRWEEVTDLTAGRAMWVSATVWQRRFGHEPVLHGRASLCLDPRHFKEQATQDAWLTLNGRGGQLLLRITMEDIQEDILFYFARAFRVLKRCEVDMVRVLIDHMSMFMRQILSRTVLRSLVRGGRVQLDRALHNVRALYASVAHGGVPVAPVEPTRTRSAPLTDPEIEAAIVPLLDYFEDTLGTLKSSLSEDEAQFVLTRVWKEVLATIESLLVPPLSDAPSDMRQLSDKEVDIVFKWLSFLRSYFNAYDPETGVAHGIPLDILQGPKYRELLSYLLLHDQTTDQLMIESVRGLQARLAATPDRRRRTGKSMLDQRSLGTIRQHKRAKEEDQPSLADMAMKILRMRPGTSDFLAQQLASIHKLQTASAAPPQQRRPSAAQSLRRASAMPALR